MGNTDSIPVVSQVKSLTQYIGGDSQAALQTQENFAYRNTFPGISQVESAVYAIQGDNGKALDLQEKFAKDMERVIDSIPVAGHIKGGIHYALGENEKGDEAMKAASHTTGAVIGGIGGFAVGGPAGAVAGGIAGGAAADGIITESDKLINGEKAKPYGVVAAGERIHDAIHGNEKISTGEAFDMAVMPVSDGVAGFGAGKVAGKPLAFGEVAGDKVPLINKAGLFESTAVEKAAAGDNIGAKTIGGGIVDENIGNSVDSGILDKKALDNRAKQLNPNHKPSGPGRPKGYKGEGSQADLDNHANQLNPNHPEYKGIVKSGDKVAVQTLADENSVLIIKTLDGNQIGKNLKASAPGGNKASLVLPEMDNELAPNNYNRYLIVK